MQEDFFAENHVRIAHDDPSLVADVFFGKACRFEKTDPCILKQQQSLVIAHVSAIIDIADPDLKPGDIWQ
jgi:hypothetical protein